MADNRVGNVDPPSDASHAAVVDRSNQVTDRQAWPTWLPIVGLAAVVLFSMVLRWRIAPIPLERDEGEYAYIAERWLAGDLPYRDAFDQKPPGIFLAYAALFAVGPQSVEAIHWLGHGSLVGTLVFVYLIGRRLWSPLVGCLAALALVVLVMDSSVLGAASNTELFAILPLAAGVYFSVRAGDSGCARDALLAGVAGGLALTFKQVSLPIVAAQLLWLVIAQFAWWRGGAVSGLNGSNALAPAVANRPMRLLVLQIVAFAGGIAAVLVPTIGYFAAKGAFREFYDCVIAHNLTYSARIPFNQYGGIFLHAASHIFVPQWPLCVALGVALAVLPRSLRHFENRVQSDSGSIPSLSVDAVCWSRGRVVVILWWLASLLAVSVGGYFREHYFILLGPPTALLAAAGISLAAQILERTHANWQGPIAVAIMLAAVASPLVVHRHYFIAADPNNEARRLYRANPFVESAAVGKLLRENSAAGDRIFIHGSEPQILFYAERASASRYIFMYPLYAAGPDAAARQQSVMDELRRNAPKFLVYVGVSTSFLRNRDSPTILGNALIKFAEESYRPFADVAVATDGRFRLIPADSPEPMRRLAENEGVSISVFIRRN